MNNAKMWLVVNPTVGIPLFLSAVAVGSFAVHVAVLTNTSWVSDFLSGQPLGTGDQAAAQILNAPKPAKVVNFSTGAQEVVIELQDGTRARAVLQVPAVRPTASPAIVRSGAPPVTDG
jgi:light-harvesting protein B-800-850 alpha chain